MSYRAYKDTDEMIADFKQRFGIKSDPDKPVFREPMIWVKNRFGAKFAVIGISKKDIWTIDGPKNLHCLVFDFTYLDGSRIGKKVQ